MRPHMTVHRIARHVWCCHLYANRFNELGFQVGLTRTGLMVRKLICLINGRAW